MIFDRVFYIGMNIDATYSRKQRYLARNRADGRTRTALGTTRSAGGGQRPAPSDTQRGAHGSCADQLNLRRLQRHTDQRPLRRRTIRVEIAYVTAIDKAVEACEDRGRLLIGNRQCTVLRARLDAEKLIFDERTREWFTSQRTRGLRTFRAFDAARIEPERFKSIRGQVGSDEINCLAHLFYQRKLQRINVLALQQGQYLLFGSKQLLFVNHNLPARRNYDLDMR